jgi:predicted MFS family arabinose efflux permease
MGFVQMAFAASQVLGIPIGLVLANAYGWHASFLLIVGVSLVVGLLIVRFVKPLTTHLRQGAPASAFRHLTGTLARPRYLMAFSATTLLATGGYLLMPFGSAFAIHNLGVTQYDLPLLFGITGVFSIGFGPLIGKLSDRIGKYRVFVIGSVFTSLLVVVYNNLGVTPLWAVVALNVAIFAGVTARMIRPRR